jgi:hypothetical protein
MIALPAGLALQEIVTAADGIIVHVRLRLSIEDRKSSHEDLGLRKDLIAPTHDALS